LAYDSLKIIFTIRLSKVKVFDLILLLLKIIVYDFTDDWLHSFVFELTG